MDKLYKTETKRTQNLKLWIYLLPVVGAIPALWTLYRKNDDLERKKASRQSIVLLFLWLAFYLALFTGADRASELMAFRLLYANALLTTGYFLICFGLMFRLQQGKSPYLPLVSSATNYLKKDRF